MSRTRTVTVIRELVLQVEVICEVTAGSPRPFGLTPSSSWVPGDEASTATIQEVKSPLGAKLNIIDELSEEERLAIEAAAIEAASGDSEADRDEAEDATADAAREYRLSGGEAGRDEE
jgi:hypothetical protein